MENDDTTGNIIDTYIDKRPVKIVTGDRIALAISMYIMYFMKDNITPTSSSLYYGKDSSNFVNCLIDDSHNIVICTSGEAYKTKFNTVTYLLERNLIIVNTKINDISMATVGGSSYNIQDIADMLIFDNDHNFIAMNIFELAENIPDNIKKLLISILTKFDIEQSDVKEFISKINDNIYTNYHLYSLDFIYIFIIIYLYLSGTTNIEYSNINSQLINIEIDNNYIYTLINKYNNVQHCFNLRDRMFICDNNYYNYLLIFIQALNLDQFAAAADPEFNKKLIHCVISIYNNYNLKNNEIMSLVGKLDANIKCDYSSIFKTKNEMDIDEYEYDYEYNSELIKLFKEKITCFLAPVPADPPAAIMDYGSDHDSPAAVDEPPADSAAAPDADDGSNNNDSYDEKKEKLQNYINNCELDGYNLLYQNKIILQRVAEAEAEVKAIAARIAELARRAARKTRKTAKEAARKALLLEERERERDRIRYEIRIRNEIRKMQQKIFLEKLKKSRSRRRREETEEEDTEEEDREEKEREETAKLSNLFAHPKDMTEKLGRHSGGNKTFKIKNTTQNKKRSYRKNRGKNKRNKSKRVVN
jgi:hypothetical protein